MKDLMGHDKKVLNKQLRLVLLRACGKAELTSEFSLSALDVLLESD